MQNYEVFINPRLSGSPVSNSELQLSSDYYVYTQTLGGGVTSQYNIRGYLNNSQNQLIIDQFAAYLQNNLSQTEMNEIYYDDRKLSIVFNKFYQTSIVNGIPSPTIYIDEQLTNTINIIIQDAYWNWDGTETLRPEGAPANIINSTRIENQREFLYEFTNEDSYYIPIKLERNYDKTAGEKFKVCNDVIDVQIEPLLAESYVGGIISANQNFFDELAAVSPSNPGVSNIVSSILQCFVDTNLETNENIIFNTNALGVSFLENRGQYTEGAGYQIPLTLSQPSVRGIEQVEIQIEYLTAGESDVAFTDNFLIQWEEGQQIKKVNITINNDLEIEQVESVRLKIVQLLNVYGGVNTTHEVFILDNTVLRKVGFESVGDGFSLVQTIRGDFIFNINALEGDLIELNVILDQPSLVGGESVDIVFSYLGFLNAATQNSDFTLISPQRVEFIQGEQSKTVQIQLEGDQIAEYIEAVTVSLSNPIGLILDGTFAPIFGTLNIQDNTILNKPVVFSLQSLFRQKGRSVNGIIGTELRELNSNATNEQSNNWLVRFGHPYNEATQPFDQNFETYPNFNFGLEIADLVITKLDLLITNQGEAIEYEGQTIEFGETFILNITGNNFQFNLPTNAVLGETAVTYGTNSFQRPIYLNANYAFAIRYTSPTVPEDGANLGFHRFELKGAETNILNLGNFSLPAQDNFSIDKYYLQSMYSNMGVTYESGGICTEIFTGENHRHLIKMNGIILLDAYANATDYFDFSFNLENELITICPTIDGFDGEVGSWQSIPYELVDLSNIPQDDGGTGGE